MLKLKSQHLMEKMVTTYLPNELALKIDGAQTYYLYSAVKTPYNDVLTSRCAWRLQRSLPCEGECSDL